MAEAAILAVATAASQAGTAVGLSTGAALAFGATVGTATVALGTVGLSVAASALLAPDAPTPPKPSNGQIEIQQPTPPRMFHYGRLRVSGPLGFLESTPLANGTAGKIVLLCAREIDAIEQHFLDDRPVVVDPETGYVTNAFLEDGDPRVQLSFHLGTDDQLADEYLLEWFPDLWTADHRLRGIAYQAGLFDDSTAEKQIKVYPQGLPTYKAQIRASKLWDLRDANQDSADRSTHVWSDNAGLAILDWLMHPKGFGFTEAQIDLPSFEDFASLCEEIVPLSTGGSEKRYRVATTVYLNEPIKNGLTRLRNACDARLYFGATGKLGIRGGKWTAPVVSLTKADLIDAQFTNGTPALSRYNELSIRYVSPDHAYTEVEGEPWVNQPDIDDYGVVTQTLDLSQVPSHTQARRLAKQVMARDNPTQAGPIKTKIIGLNIIDQEVVDIAWDELDGGADDFNGAFWIEGDTNLVEEFTGIATSIRRADPDSFDWDELTEEGTPPAIPPAGDIAYEEGVAPDPVTGVTATAGSQSAIIAWTLPAQDEDNEVYALRVWRATANNFDDAVDVSGPILVPRESDGDFAVSTMEFVDPIGSGVQYYWVTSENTVGDRGTPVAADASVTVLPPGYAFVVDHFGRFIVDDAGSYVLAEV